VINHWFFPTAGRAVSVVVCLFCACPFSTISADEFSRAETALWLTNQLKTISEPSTFTYKFQRSGSYDPDFEDTVRFHVTNVHEDGMKSASVAFFSGVRRVDVPAVDRTDVNPILKIFLQGDVYEMNRLTDVDGKFRERWRYFQRKIKLALAESATIEETSVAFNGINYVAIAVSIQPFLDDQKLMSTTHLPVEMQMLYRGIANKSYRVVVSDQLPGFLYRIETTVPGRGNGDDPLIREVLQLVETP
jgi:hypothetical protein